MKTILLSLTLLVLTSCAANSQKSNPTESSAKVTTSESAQEAMPATKTPDGPTATPAQAAKNCICTKIWMPVCGTANKKTYGNSCEADCAGVKYTQGACPTKAKTK